MSSAWSRPAGAALALICLALPAAAGEATKKGRNADVHWTDADGRERTTAGGEIRYVHHERTYLSVPRRGRHYKDRTREHKGIPTGHGFIPFAHCVSIEFVWPETATDPMVLRIRKHDGEAVEVRGGELAGADHPEAPYVEFRSEGKTRRLPIDPLGAGTDAPPGPKIRRLEFTL